ncbi:MAG: hypothetical protein ACRC56_11810 [Bosea sp. (in: a-proteobacteria)]
MSRCPSTVSVLLACEREAHVRDAFLALGFDAWSCDIESSSAPSNRHIQDDVLRVMGQHRWDLMLVAHPPCTILCNSGARWLYKGGRGTERDEARWEALERACAFYRQFRDASYIPLRAIENPVMHQHARELTQRGMGSEVQTVQPWWFGHESFKATTWELFGTPKLCATNRLTPPKPGTDEHKRWSVVHRMSPGPDRARLRSETPVPVAQAYAAQWGAAALRLPVKRRAA